MVKRFYTLVLLVLTIGIGQAQTWNVGIHTNNDKFYGQMWTTNQEINLLEFQSYDRYTMWLKYSSAGSLIWQKRICSDLLCYAPLSNNQLLVGHSNFDCDAGGNITMLSLYDTSANLSFSVPLTYSPTGAHVLNDSTYWVFNSQLLSIFNGSVFTTINWNYNKVNCLLNIDPDTVLVSAQSNSVNCLFRYTATAIKIDSIITPTTVYDLDSLNTGFIIASGTNGTLYKYNHHLALQGNSSANPYKFYTHQITRNDTIIGIALQNNLQSVVYLNSTFQTLHASPFSTVQHTLLSVCLNKSQLITVSNLHQGLSNQIGLKASTLTGNINFNHDAEISLNTVTPDSSFNFFQYKIYRFKANVTIKNNGTGNLNTVHIYKHAGYNFNCFQYINFKEYTVNLSPSAQTTLNVSGYHFRYDPLNPATAVDICLYVSMPNNESDSGTPNNESCVSLPVAQLGLKSIPSLVEHYPNPFHQTLLFKNVSPIEKISVFNLEGQLLYQFEPKSSEVELSTADWKNGMYLIECSTSMGKTYQKVLKN